MKANITMWNVTVDIGREGKRLIGLQRREPTGLIINTAPPLSKLPAYAGVSLGMALWTQPAVSAYGADQALPLIDRIRYDDCRHGADIVLSSAAQLQCCPHPCQQHVFTRRQRIQVGKDLLQRGRRLLHVKATSLRPSSRRIQ